MGKASIRNNSAFGKRSSLKFYSPWEIEGHDRANRRTDVCRAEDELSTSANINLHHLMLVHVSSHSKIRTLMCPVVLAGAEGTVAAAELVGVLAGLAGAGSGAP